MNLHSTSPKNHFIVFPRPVGSEIYDAHSGLGIVTHNGHMSKGILLIEYEKK
ncbi:MAG: hypothetical protein VW127_02920 [Flavobacteriaceae bacterium]